MGGIPWKFKSSWPHQTTKVSRNLSGFFCYRSKGGSMSKRNKRVVLLPKKQKFIKKKKKMSRILGLEPKMINSVVNALSHNNSKYIRKIVDGLSEYELARILEALDNEQRLQLVEILGDKINPDVFPELNEVVQEQIIENLDEDQVVKIVNELDSDEAVEILEHMDDDEQAQIINRLDPELKYQVKSSFSYPEDSAGRIMSRDFVALSGDMTVKDARQYLLKEQDLPDEFYEIFITNSLYQPIGQISLDKLIRSKSSAVLNEIMDGEVCPIDAYTDQEEVAHMFREYGWMSAMVVDNKGRLVGTITVDDIVHIIHEEANEDIMHLSGTEEGDVYKSVFNIFKSRSVWLITNLFATIMAASVVKGFQDIIAEISTLAVLMPIVASMGGTTGQQTLAVVVRALATKELTSRNTLRVIGKEFTVGMCNGLLFAALIWGVTHIMFPDKIMISNIIAVAMLCNLMIASLAGILIPLTLNKLKVDPAISSGVFLIAMTDSGGFFIFLGLAKLLLF